MRFPATFSKKTCSKKKFHEGPSAPRARSVKLLTHLQALAWDLLSCAFPPATARSSLRPTILSHRFLTVNRCYRHSALPLMGHRHFVLERAQHALTGHHRHRLQRKMCIFNDFPLLLLLFKRGPWGSSERFLLNMSCPNRRGTDADMQQEPQSPTKSHASHFCATPGLWG